MEKTPIKSCLEGRISSPSAVAAAVLAGLLAIQTGVSPAHATRSVTIPWIGSNSVALSFYTPYLGVGMVGIALDHGESRVHITVDVIGAVNTRASYQFSTSDQEVLDAGNFCHQSSTLRIPSGADILIVLIAQIGATFPFTDGPCNSPAIAGTMSFAFS